MNLVVDLNADLGEGAGHDSEILDLVSSANIACGFHAGDPASIFASIQAARERGVAVGAHPSFADRENFGRTEMTVPPEEVYSLVSYQVGAFHALATAAGTRANHVKAHGALYNMAVRDEKLAEAIVHAVLAIDSSLLVFAPAESALERAAQSAKLTRCCTIPKKPRSECSECCAKAWFVRSTERMSKSTRKQFAFTATRPAPSRLLDLFARAWKRTVFRFRRPSPGHEYLAW
jgi:hypothetical protein